MEITCQSCGAELIVDALHKSATCPYCSSSSVVERPPREDRPVPTFALGFGLDQARARERVRQWLRSRSLFTHSGVKGATLEDVRGVYLPAYLYSAAAESRYSAQIGEEYTETYTVTVDGKRETRTRTCTEWRPLSGVYSDYVADVLVTAARGLSNAELEHLEPFDLRVMHRYTPATLSGWIAEEPSRPQHECVELARTELIDRIGRRLKSFLPGDKHRDLHHEVHVQRETVDLVMVPIWVLAARYAKDAPAFRLLVNGQTGEVFGKAPLSQMKIALAIGAGLLAIAGLFLWLSSQGFFR